MIYKNSELDGYVNTLASEEKQPHVCLMWDSEAHINHHERLLIPLRKTDAPGASSVPVCIDVVLSEPSSLCILIKQCRSNCKFLQMWE